MHILQTQTLWYYVHSDSNQVTECLFQYEIVSYYGLERVGNDSEIMPKQAICADIAWKF